MTAFDIIVPAVALVFAIGAVIVARAATKRFDAKYGTVRHSSRHPAE